MVWQGFQMLYLFSNADCWHLLLLKEILKTGSLFVPEHRVGESGESSITQQIYAMSVAKCPVLSMSAIAVRSKVIIKH